MIKSLSSLRFIFAILVFMVHIEIFKVAVGHAFFIILSGFIMSLVYEKRLLNKEITFKQFFKKRLIRIYPLHILTLIAAVPFNLDGIIEKTVNWTGKFFINLFFLQTFFPNINIYFSFNGVSWNAADLMIFYAFFPVLIILFSKINIKIFTLLIVVIVIFITVCMINTPIDYHHYLFYISPFFRIFDFIFGMYLYKLIRNATYSQNYFTSSVLEIMSLAFLVFCFLYAHFNVEIMQPYVYSIYLWIPLSLVISIFYFEKGLISQKILSTKVMVALGGLSYSFYMLHHLIIRYGIFLNEKYHIIKDTIFLYLLCFLVSLFLAYLSNKYFEKYFSKKFNP